MALTSYLKVVNNVVVNTEIWDTEPQDAGDVTYIEPISNVGIGFEKKSDHWYYQYGEGDYVKVGFDGSIVERVIPSDSA